MAVVGIDFGSLHSKIGVARHRGIDIIANEVSNRATPSLVAFGPKQRSIGESAKTQETSNFKNTVGSLKRLVGRTINDPEIENVERKFLNAQLVDVDGTVGVKVNYIGEPHSFSATQLVGAYLAKLRDIAANELKNTVTDVVIAVPTWFTEVQRRAVIDAASIAGLNVLRLINDSTAAALGYGITKSDLPEPDSPRHVAFVDVGHSSMTVTVVAFVKGHLSIISTASDRHIGGRDIDFALVHHFAEEFKTKYKINVIGNAKATFRLSQGCEKLKKILSANAEAPLNVESIMNDVDASSKLTRERMEELISHVLDRIPAVLDRAISDSGLTLEQIDSVELLGGSTRMPAVRARIQEAFGGKTLSTTLNADEAVARGATFSCAMASPIFRVRDFSIQDINHYPIKVHWDRAPGDGPGIEDTELEVFSKGNNVPSTKVLSFYRKDPFDVECSYVDPQGLPGGINPWIGRFIAKSVPEVASSSSSAGADMPCVRLKVRLTQHSTMSFEAAYVEESVMVEEEVTDTAAAAAAGGDMEVDGDKTKEEEKKKKKKVIKTPVPFITGNTSLDSTVLERLREREAEMYANDKLVVDTEDRKNALEEYVYDTRSKLSDRYASYITPDEKSTLLAALQDSEDWLYTEEGEDAMKSAYVERLDALHALGDLVHVRWKENEERPRYVSALRQTLDTYLDKAQSPSNNEGAEGRYSHIPTSEKQKIISKCAETQKWLDDLVYKQGEMEKWRDPVLKGDDVLKRRDEVIYFVTPILSKPKPKAPVPPSTAGSGTGSGTQTPKSEEAEKEKEKEKTEEGPGEMDID